MRINWTGQRVVIIGAARQGTALARYLAEAGAHVTLTDQRNPAELQTAQASLAGLPITWVCGGHPLTLLDNADWLCPSGGVPLDSPLLLEAARRAIPLTNDSQIFLENAPCRVLGITGSAGKTTTTTLVGRIAQAALAGDPNRRVWVGGNIGNPLISQLAQIQPADLAVLELSSFQLEIMTRSPQIAAILNLTPNHLDRHGDMAAYTAAKAHILAHQSPNDIAVLGLEDPIAWSLRSQTPARVWSFGRNLSPQRHPGTFVRPSSSGGDAVWLWDGQTEQELLPLNLIMLRGEHNLLNVLAACAIAAAAGLPGPGLPAAAMQQAVNGFGGVPHRLEFVRRWRGADWYNDSIATAPERAMAALRSFSEPLILLAGGRDKNLPWADFGQLVQQRVRNLIVFGEAADKIAAAVVGAHGVRPAPTLQTIQHCPNLEQAVQAAAALAQPGDVILLSPGGTSFDEFRDFEQRGEAYRLWVSNLS